MVGVATLLSATLGGVVSAGGGGAVPPETETVKLRVAL